MKRPARICTCCRHTDSSSPPSEKTLKSPGTSDNSAKSSLQTTPSKKTRTSSSTPPLIIVENTELKRSHSDSSISARVQDSESLLTIPTTVRAITDTGSAVSRSILESTNQRNSRNYLTPISTRSYNSIAGTSDVMAIGRLRRESSMHQEVPRLGWLFSGEVDSDRQLWWMPRSQAYRHVLGTGAFATVYLGYGVEVVDNSKEPLVREALPKFRVAIKRFSSGRAWSPTELQIQKRLRHTNVLRVFGAFHRRAIDPGIFLLLEFANALDLRSVFDALHVQRLGFDTVVNVGAQMLRAVEYLHQEEVYHRDIKPENFVLCLPNSVRLVNWSKVASIEALLRQVVVKICDFGIALERTAVDSGNQTTTVFSHVYAAPEVIAGEKCIDFSAADVFALGITLYELAWNEHPFWSESQRLSRQLLFNKQYTPAHIMDVYCRNSGLPTHCQWCIDKESPNRNALSTNSIPELPNLINCHSAPRLKTIGDSPPKPQHTPNPKTPSSITSFNTYNSRVYPSRPHESVRILIRDFLMRDPTQRPSIASYRQRWPVELARQDFPT